MPGEPEPPPLPAPRLPPYRPTSRAQRWLIVLLTVVTVAGLAALMLRPHQRLMGAKATRAEAARTAACPSDQASAAPGCPGGRMQVMVLPAAASGQSGAAQR